MEQLQAEVRRLERALAQAKAAADEAAQLREALDDERESRALQVPTLSAVSSAGCKRALKPFLHRPRDPAWRWCDSPTSGL